MTARKKVLYFVEWSAPDYRNAGNMVVTAYNQTDAIKQAKKKLGRKVKSQYLHHFDSWYTNRASIGSRRIGTRKAL